MPATLSLADLAYEIFNEGEDRSDARYRQMIALGLVAWGLAMRRFWR